MHSALNSALISLPPSTWMPALREAWLGALRENSLQFRDSLDIAVPMRLRRIRPIMLLEAVQPWLRRTAAVLALTTFRFRFASREGCALRSVSRPRAMKCNCLGRAWTQSGFKRGILKTAVYFPMPTCPEDVFKPEFVKDLSAVRSSCLARCRRPRMPRRFRLTKENGMHPFTCLNLINHRDRQFHMKHCSSRYPISAANGCEDGSSTSNGYATHPCLVRCNPIQPEEQIWLPWPSTNTSKAGA